MMKRVTLYVTGNVQRAGYRTKVISIAKQFGIKGNVRNLADGRVKIIAEGEQTDLNRFIQAVNIKNTLINVIGIEQEYSLPAGDYERFYKLVDEGETDERLDTAADLLKDLIGVTKNGFDRLENNQKIMIVNQDQMLDKQDQMLGKQDQMLGKQDQMLGKQDQMLDKQDQMLDKQDQTIGKIDQTRIEITSEIHALRDDFRSHIDARLSNVESELAQIKAKIML
ncbi:MAG TPA: acylphosphatase [archaeon]|nr:acylphosphatase [archaeon]